MSTGPPETVELTPDAAVAFLSDELALAADSHAAGNADAALDAYVRAVGLALQLGPAACEQALDAVLAGARRMTHNTLSALGPALVQLHDQVRDAGALSDNPVMQSWASVVAYCGMLIGVVGVAGALPAGDRQGMVHKARTAATQLDEQTGQLLDFAGWVGDVVTGWH